MFVLVCRDRDAAETGLSLLRLMDIRNGVEPSDFAHPVGSRSAQMALLLARNSQFSSVVEGAEVTTFNGSIPSKCFHVATELVRLS